MLSTLFSLQLTAMVSALGLNTDEWVQPSPAIVAQVQAISDAMAAAAKGEQPKTPLQETINAIKDLADKNNDKDAQFSIGLFLQQSNQPGSVEQALEYYKKAAASGQLHAMNNWGFLTAASTQDEAKVKEGIASIRAAADKGFNPARRNMAAIILRGMAGEKQDSAAALKLLESAAAAKDDQAQFELAQFYLGGGGETMKSDDKAWDWLNKAADAGNPNALATLGSVLFDGKKFGEKEIKADEKKAVEKFTKLADQGVPAGLRTMAELHQGGLAGVPKDFTKALDYFVKAAQGNDAVAQVRLASFYDAGVDLDPQDSKVDVAPNAAAALELYRLAAQNGVPLAIYNVGTFYEAGRAVDRDAQKAFAFFLQSAVNGFLLGMQKAGVYYLNGAGTLRDPVAATSWFTRTAAAGLPEGLLSLGLMAENGLFMGSADATPFRTAADQYQKAADAPSAADEIRVEALLRLGGLYARGLMVAAGAQAQPEPGKAYTYFKQAADLVPANTQLKTAVEEAAKQLTAEQRTKADADAEQMKKDREAKKQAALSGEAQASPAAAAAAATPAPAATTPAATPTTPATAPAAPASSSPAPAAEPPKKPSGGFRIPGLGGN
jgi:TPR repeat protein